MLFSTFRRLLKEDFDPENQALIDKLAFVINPLIETMTRAFTRNLSFDDNINCQVKSLEITVDSSGVPTQTTSFRSSLTSKSQGIFCVRAQNLTNSSTYPSGGVLISFTENQKIITIQHVTGLQANNKYQLKIISIA